MKRYWSMSVLAVCCLVPLLLQDGLRAQDKPAAGDEAAIRAINTAWFSAHRAGDAKTIAGLYADDAVVGGPGSPAVKGRASLNDFFANDVAATMKDGLSLTSSPTTEVGISGDFGWEWGTFTVTNKSGAVVDKGKFLTVFQKRGGKWLIVRDMWNSDGPQKDEKMK
jgi:uncharacterized protein (TIGR02246 family)